MELRVVEEQIDRLDEHATIPIAFRVEKILAVSAPYSGMRGIGLVETAVDRPWVKNYDALKGEGPTRWPTRFDTANWGLLAAYDGDQRVGGAVIAFKTAGVRLLESKPDTAVLWDLRVRPERRGRGVGSALFHAACAWSCGRSCGYLLVETQNVNFAACHFYARMGCTLAAIDTHAYPDLPDEAQLIWYKAL